LDNLYLQIWHGRVNVLKYGLTPGTRVWRNNQQISLGFKRPWRRIIWVKPGGQKMQGRAPAQALFLCVIAWMRCG
jgi:hypothetical protein